MKSLFAKSAERRAFCPPMSWLETNPHPMRTGIVAFWDNLSTPTLGREEPTAGQRSGPRRAGGGAPNNEAFVSNRTKASLFVDFLSSSAL